MACKICEIRRPRRYCPGVQGDICSQCCGEQREVTVDCPLECEYLQEAHLHERVPEPDPDQFPNRDIRVTDTFLRDHEALLILTGVKLFRAAADTPGAVDLDVREALEALIKTFRTLDSGLYYETRPENTVASAIQTKLQEAFEEFRKRLAESQSAGSLRDAEILGVLVFMQRLERTRNNGRRRGRAFLDFLRQQFHIPAVKPGAVII